MTDKNIFTIIPYKDHWIKFSNSKSARAIYKNKIIDLISGQEFVRDWTEWFKEFDTRIDVESITPRITHFFYELGFLIEKVNEVGEETILAIDIEYKKIESLKSLPLNPKINLELINSVNFKDFKKSFLEGREELLLGNCYQFNLTCEHQYQWLDNLTPMNFISALWNDPAKKGAFGSATYIPFFKMLYLSNSPECLFQMNKNILSTMPIKGTMPLENNFKTVWKKLINDKKNESELFMIIDLMRNDLARIELPRAKVVAKKLPLIVPGLLHQYALIEIELSNKVTLKNILEKIFPGGSVTGAPKKSVLKILKTLEKRERRFYCGSTFINFKQIKCASINIRSSEIDFENKKLSYQSGGGITLKSTPKEEFLEMISKRESFIRSL